MHRPWIFAAVLLPTLAAAQGGKPLCCPVTRLEIASAKAAVGKSVYKKRTYYFCTANCKKTFDKNPAKYAK